MVLLARLDQSLRGWHVVTANVVALLWFAGVTIFGRAAMPTVALFRCPVGFCAGGYPPEDLYSMLDEIGEEGRRYLYESTLIGDIVLPLLLLAALVLDIVWFSRPLQRGVVGLQAPARMAMLAVPVLYFLADYLENAAVAQLLRHYPDLEDAMALRASMLTAAKSQLFAASFGIAAALAIVSWARRMGARRPGQAPLDPE